MRVEFKKNDELYDVAYSGHYFGFEFIYIENEGKKILLIENRLAILGIWLNDKQIAHMLQPILDNNYPFISKGDKICIESYKHRNGIYDKHGFLNSTPDVVRTLLITD